MAGKVVLTQRKWRFWWVTICSNTQKTPMIYLNRQDCPTLKAMMMLWVNKTMLNQMGKCNIKNISTTNLNSKALQTSRASNSTEKLYEKSKIKFTKHRYTKVYPQEHKDFLFKTITFTDCSKRRSWISQELTYTLTSSSSKWSNASTSFSFTPKWVTIAKVSSNSISQTPTVATWCSFSRLLSSSWS